MLKLSEHKRFLPADTLAKADLPLKLATFERSMLGELVIILTPFEEATPSTKDSFQAAGYVLPCIKGLRNTLKASCLEMKTKPLDFWCQEKTTYPKNCGICIRHSGIISSSWKSIHVAGKIYTPDRYRLNDSRFEQLMFIKCNLWCLIIIENNLIFIKIVLRKDKSLWRDISFEKWCKLPHQWDYWLDVRN